MALPQAEIKVPYVDTGDIGDVAVEALLHNKHNGKIYQLTGPRLLTFRDVIKEISEANKRDITFKPITLSAYINVMKEQGVPADFVWLIEYLFTEVLGNPNNAEITCDIENVLGRKPKDFSEYVRETTAAGIWN